MTLSLLTSPSANSAAYEYESMLYEWIDFYTYSAISDNGGLLRLTLTAPAIADMSVGDSLWISSLVGFDLIDNPIAEITELSGVQATVNVAYSASYTSSGTVRLMISQQFVIQTGFTGNTDQPLRQRFLDLRPDPNGLYRVNPYQEVISRFKFRKPTISPIYDNTTKLRVYPIVMGTGTFVNAYKTIQYSIPSQIRYEGLSNLVNYYDVNVLKTAFETARATELAGSSPIELEIEIYLFDCVDYVFTYDTLLAEEFFTFDSETWVTIQTSGLALTGFTFNFNGQSSGTYTWSIVYDDGASIISYSFTIYVQNAIACRPSCGGRRFFWWSRLGGWRSYEFNRAIVTEVVGGQSQLKQVSNQVSAVRYDRQQQAIQLLADYEGQDVLDYLRDMLYSLNVYEVITLDSVEGTLDFATWYLNQANGATKRTQPYLVTSNRFTIDLIKGEIEERINEGR